MIMGKQERKWQDVGYVLAYFGRRKGRPVAKARKRFCQLAKEMGYSGAAVARYLGVTTSLVNYYAASIGKVEPRR